MTSGSGVMVMEGTGEMVFVGSSINAMEEVVPTEAVEEDGCVRSMRQMPSLRSKIVEGISIEEKP